MRTALYSDNERNMVKKYLETGEKGTNFKVLKHRIRKSQNLIMNDFDLMISILTKFATASLNKPEKGVLPP